VPVVSVETPSKSTHAVGRCRKIMVIGSYAPALVTFRGDLLAAMVKAGNEVIAIAPEHDENVAAALKERGVTFLTVPMARATISPFLDIRTLAHLLSLMRRERPDSLLTYNMKPIVYGGIAGRIARIPNRYAMIAGLGFIFSDDGVVGAGRRILRQVAGSLYRLAMRGAKAVIVFNPDDAAEVVSRGIVAPGQKLVQVAGSGIELTRFCQVAVPKGPPVFLLIARLIRQKGLLEYVAAARKLRARFPEARVQLLGPLDPSPTGISRSELDGWIQEGAIEYLGETRDVRPYLAASTVYVLPSFYREGIPRTVIEALATGRAIITTNSPGCRETVIEGENGYLVPPRDADGLAATMAQFVRDPSLAVRMGERSRQLAVARFDVTKVNATLLSTMGLR
jgi:glycosyltransferase involved in cell wall biosynthesis